MDKMMPYTETDKTTIESPISVVILNEGYTDTLEDRNVVPSFTSQMASQVFAECVADGCEPQGITGMDNLHPDLWSLPFLVDFIIENHHHFAKKQLPLIAELIDYVIARHGKSYATLFDIQKLFHSFSESFYKHIFRKEEEFFAYIKRIYRLSEEGKQVSSPYFGSILELENQLSAEYNIIENNLAQLRQITNNFLPPDNSCTSHQHIYKLLRALYHNTRQQIYLENYLVFPEALELEKKVLTAKTLI